MWKNGKKWVYSITYDEGCQALLENALPVHLRYGMPGHVALVADEVGAVRKVAGSSYEEWMIINRSEVDMLVSEGWGVSCHGMTHAGINPGNAQFEVVEARRALEKKLRRPVTIFCVPNDNSSYPAALAVAAGAGYTAVMTITDMVNLPGEMHRMHPSGTFPSAQEEETHGILNLGRTPLHTQHPPPFYSAYDPYRRIHQAADTGGWIIDYCHCPMPGKAVHPWKDCTLEQLEERFRTVLGTGGSDVWLAEPNEVVEYILHNNMEENNG